MQAICRYTGFIFVVFSLLLQSCGRGAAKQENPLNEHADSLSIKLNSPELKAVNAALLQDVNNDSLYNLRAIIYLKLRQMPEAENDAKRAIAMDSLSAGNYLTLADIYFAQNNTRQSKELLEKVAAKFPQNTEALLKLAELYYFVQHYQESIDFVNKALRVNENIAKAYYIKGSVYRESGDTTRAINSLITAIEQDSRMDNAYYDLGIIYAARRNPLALQYYENALQVNSSRSDVKYARAKFLQDIGKIDEAITEYEALSKSDPSCYKCFYNLGALQLEIKHNTKLAIDYFTSAVKLKQDYTEAYLARGYAYAKLKDKAAAKADYNMCLQLQPNYPLAIQGLNEL